MIRNNGHGFSPTIASVYYGTGDGAGNGIIQGGGDDNYNLYNTGPGSGYGDIGGGLPFGDGDGSGGFEADDRLAHADLLSGCFNEKDSA